MQPARAALTTGQGDVQRLRFELRLKLGVGQRFPPCLLFSPPYDLVSFQSV